MEFEAEGVPDATTLLKFRRRLETHDLCKALFTAINADLVARGLERRGIVPDKTRAEDAQAMKRFFHPLPFEQREVFHHRVRIPIADGISG